MSLADVCWNISSVFIVITLGVIAILCVLMLLGVFVCIFDHDDNHKNDKNSKGITMATNATEKDKTLNEIIDLCVEKRVHYRQFLNDFMLTHSEDWHDSADVTYGERIMFLRGKIQAFDECAACCESMLGYSGSMPSEVPNQSEDAKK